MTDPRQTLSFTSLTKVISEPVTNAVGVFPRTTRTDPNQPKATINQQFGGYQYENQDPVAEGEIIVWYKNEFGERLAEMYVAIDIDGVLTWKELSLFSFTVNQNTGQRTS